MKVTLDAVEKWAEEVAKYCTSKLTIEQSEYLITIMMSGEQMEDDKLVKEMASKGYAKAIIERFERFGMSISNTAAIFLSTCVKSFGEVAMVTAYVKYCFYKFYYGKRIAKGSVTVDWLCSSCFPMGIPTREDWDRLWDLQKLDAEELKMQRSMYKDAPDNVLDYNGAYTTIN